MLPIYVTTHVGKKKSEYLTNFKFLCVEFYHIFVLYGDQSWHNCFSKRRKCYHKIEKQKHENKTIYWL